MICFREKTPGIRQVVIKNAQLKLRHLARFPWICVISAFATTIIYVSRKALSSHFVSGNVSMFDLRQRLPLANLDDHALRRCFSLSLEPEADVWVTSLRSWKKFVMPQFGWTIQALVSEHGFIDIKYDVIRDLYSELRDTDHDVSSRLALLSPTKRVPSVILVWDSYTYDPEFIKWLRRVAPIFYFLDDLHFHSDEEKARKLATLSSVDFVFSTYAYHFTRFYPKLASLPVKWLPHAASPDFDFDGLNTNASNTALLSGAMSWHYPLRHLANKLASNDSRIQILHHPGYNDLDPSSTTVTVGQRFGQALHAHRASITCGLVYHYVVAKMFEIPSTGSLLIVGNTVVPELAELGFYEGVHFLSFKDKDSLKQALDLALSNDAMVRARIDSMRLAAQRVVASRHTTSIRARELATELRLWAGAWHGRDFGLNQCWDAFTHDATIPFIEPADEQSNANPPPTRFRQVMLLSRTPPDI